jgi:hypothetical protein
MNPILEQLSLIGIVPVVAIDDAKDAVPLANAMAKGGIRCAEVTLRTAAGLDSIRAISENCPDVLVGAGTVLTLDQCKAAVGGSWVCAKKDIADGSFDKITALCREARQIALGYELAHVGVNTDSTDAARQVADQFESAFGFAVKAGNSSHFAGTAVEAMNEKYLGANGHLAIRTANIARAVADLESKGFKMAAGTEKRKDGKLTAVYLEQEFGGFAVHLLQK